MHVVTRSRIVHVSVHARGALVSRSVELPRELPDEEVDLVVPDVTPLADAGSVRAELAGARQVISVHSALHVPETPAQAGASVEKVQALQRRMVRLQAEQTLLETRREQLAKLTPDPRLRAGARLDPVDTRVADALAASSLIGDLLAGIDARAAANAEHMQELQHEIDAAALDDAQRASGERMGTGHPTRRVTVRLGGGGAIDRLDLSYVVPAARWWPVYTLRLTDGGKRAAWWLEALVAQLSGESWSGVRISLATADLVRDARLPELPSLRLGRAQPAPRKAYRPPPEGLDRMFEAYDRAFVEPMTTRAGMVMGPPPRPVAAPVVVAIAPPSMAMPAFAPSSMPPMPGGMPAPQAAAPVRMRMAKKSMGLGMAVGGAARDEEAEVAAEAPPPEPESIEPRDAWLDFDALTMAPAGDRARRGRLVLGTATPPFADSSQANQLIYALAPAKVVDPASSRGLFDHRYDAAGAADVPSDAIPHRITLGIAEAPASLLYRTVPRETLEVYKEARLINPFPSPLLAGPVDVYVEGSLLLTSQIDRIDVGGAMTIGLGVEDRIRVARNARVDEDTSGMLRSSTVVDSEVTIDLTSSLGREAKVEVLDRIPVTDDDACSVELVASEPKAEDYHQVERGAPLRKGLRWSVTLAPSGKGKIVFRYKITFSAKNELVGGNRRE